MFQVFFYRDHRGRCQVYEFIEELNKKSQAQVLRTIELLAHHGPNLLRPYADHVRGKLRELRVRTLDGNIRIFYFFVVKDEIVVLYAFKKKTQQLPEIEIQRALRLIEGFME